MPGTRARAAGAAAPSPAGDVLALQRSAGNHAVTQMLARKETATPEKAKAATEYTAQLDPDLAVPVHSFSLGGRKGALGGAGGGTGGEASREGHDVTFTSPEGDHSAVLVRALADGRHFSAITVTGKVKFTLTDCIVTSFQSGATSSAEEAVENWSVNCRKIDYDVGKKP